MWVICIQTMFDLKIKDEMLFKNEISDTVGINISCFSQG